MYFLFVDESFYAGLLDRFPVYQCKQWFPFKGREDPVVSFLFCFFSFRHSGVLASFDSGIMGRPISHLHPLSLCYKSDFSDVLK